jgi:hypothetical protein
MAVDGWRMVSSGLVAVGLAAAAAGCGVLSERASGPPGSDGAARAGQAPTPSAARHPDRPGANGPSRAVASEALGTATTSAGAFPTTTDAAGIGTSLPVEFAAHPGPASLLVTVNDVDDPAPVANPFYAAPVGERLVAVDLSVETFAAPVSIDLGDRSLLVGSDGRSYREINDPVMGCTQADGRQLSLRPGQSRASCVVFALPTKISAVQFELADTQVVAHWHLRG